MKQEFLDELKALLKKYNADMSAEQEIYEGPIEIEVNFHDTKDSMFIGNYVDKEPTK